jgi:hypothetical protein
LVLGAVAMLALLPAKADAQFIRYSPIFWSFDVNAGVALPMGDLGDVSKAGVAIAGGAAYFLNPRLALVVKGGADFLKGDSGSAFDGGEGPDLTVIHYTAGIEGHLADPTGEFTAAINVGVGGASFDTDLFAVDDLDCSGTVCSPSTGARTTSTFSQTYFAAQGGLTLGYNFARQGTNNIPVVTFFIAGNVHLIFADSDDTKVLAGGYGVSPFDSMFEIPITVGLRFNIP